MNDIAGASIDFRPATSSRILSAAEIEKICGAALENPGGFDGLVGLTTLSVPRDRHLVFLDAFAEERLASISAAPSGTLFVLPPAYRGAVFQPALFVEEVRECFSRLSEALFDYNGRYWTGFESSEQAAERNSGTRIMPGCQIHHTVSIGSGTMVMPGNVIGPGVTIGRDCFLNPNSVIGFSGFGVFQRLDGRNRHLPHVGSVVIGDEVELGGLNSVCAGTIHPTVVEDTVKTDSHVHIAHNCRIRRGAKLTAHAELSGSVEVGRDAWLGPNSSVRESLVIGADALVGIGSNVVRSVPAGTLVAGNPARVVRRIKEPAEPSAPEA